MYNKSKLKNFIKAARKATISFSKEQGWILDGYALFTLNDPMMLEVLKEFFFKADKLCILHGKEQGEPIDPKKIIQDTRGAETLELTPYLHTGPKYEARILLDKDGSEIWVQQKYLDILDKCDNYQFTQVTYPTGPVYIMDKETMIGLILPIKVNEEQGYQLVRK